MAAVAWGLYITVGYSQAYLSCAVGFSAVLFAIKVVLQDSEPASSTVRLMGFIEVPTRLAYWAELGRLLLELIALYPHPLSQA